MRLLRLRALRLPAHALTAFLVFGACTDRTEPTPSPVVVRSLGSDSLRPGPMVIRSGTPGRLPAYAVACEEQMVGNLEQPLVTADRSLPAEAAVWCAAAPVGSDGVGRGQIPTPGAHTNRLRTQARVDRPTGPMAEAISARLVIP
jgi:hypothetical protein